MKYFTLLFVFSLFSFLSIKDLPIWNPKQGVLVDKSKEGEAEFIANQKKYFAMVEKGYENLSETEKEFLVLPTI
ncbi:hypothetical protein ACE193_01090 [Bernardetia sp. OM2101]|uniref:hypothetical protein n=1 Tax=Bernardetia sp. OM2101 TaxID=3344876 RepID=UPI0035CF15AD